MLLDTAIIWIVRRVLNKPWAIINIPKQTFLKLSDIFLSSPCDIYYYAWHHWASRQFSGRTVSTNPSVKVQIVISCAWCVIRSECGSLSVYRLLEEVLPLLLSRWGRQGRLAGSYVSDTIAVVTCRKNTFGITRNLVYMSNNLRVPLSLKEAIKKHSADVMQPTYNLLI